MDANEIALTVGTAFLAFVGSLIGAWVADRKRGDPLALDLLQRQIVIFGELVPEILKTFDLMSDEEYSQGDCENHIGRLWERRVKVLFLLPRGVADAWEAFIDVAAYADAGRGRGRLSWWGRRAAPPRWHPSCECERASRWHSRRALRWSSRSRAL